MNFRTTAQLKCERKTKGDLAAELYGDMTYDTAIPQSWLDDANARSMDLIVEGGLASHFVTVYPEYGVPYVAPLTADGVKVCAILASVK